METGEIISDLKTNVEAGGPAVRLDIDRTPRMPDRTSLNAIALAMRTVQIA
jgi:hypothetical protein